jgi:hypothetical protein
VRFILKVYKVDPLICPKYQNEMKITSILEENAVTREKYCSIQGLSETRNHSPPIRDSPHTPEFTYDDAYSQILSNDYFLQ